MNSSVPVSAAMLDFTFLSKFTRINYKILLIASLGLSLPVFVIEMGFNYLDICADLAIICFAKITITKTIPRTFEVLTRRNGKFNLVENIIDLKLNTLTGVIYVLSSVISIISYERYKVPLYLMLLYMIVTYFLEAAGINENDYDRRQLILNPGCLDYGMGMAYNFYKGYLEIILPNCGKVDNAGIKNAIKLYENNEGVEIPVKKLFILIPRSLKCPPVLEEMNIPGADIQVDESKNLRQIIIDRSACKQRIYQNTVYRLHRGTKTILCVVAEFATPLLTYSTVMQHDKNFEEYRDEITKSFIKTLERLLSKDPTCEGLCELLYYDDINFTVNVPELILERVNSILDQQKRRVSKPREDIAEKDSEFKNDGASLKYD